MGIRENRGFSRGFAKSIDQRSLDFVRNVFGRAENAPPDRQSRSIRLQSCGRLKVFHRSRLPLEGKLSALALTDEVDAPASRSSIPYMN